MQGSTIKTVLLLFILHLSSIVNAQSPQTSQDSIRIFYGALFSKLEKGFLYKDSVNWQTVEAKTTSKLSRYTDFRISLKEIETLFSQIGATHCAVYYKDGRYGVSANISLENYSDQWNKKYAAKPGFEAKVIDGKYGYILMPALVFLDTRRQNVNKIAQNLYDQIVALKTKNQLDGWIVDLRFNTGGNSWPMLLALYDLLGDHDILGTLDADKKLVSTTSLSKGKYIVDSKKQYRIKPKGKLLERTEVAIITGGITASSGEIVAMAFKGRPKTIFIGESSLGFTTTNYGASLPFGTMMTLTGSYDSDRNGIYYERIIPDIPISKQDNFDNLLLDKNIQEAMKFISQDD